MTRKKLADTSESARPRSLSNVVATKPGCTPLKEAYRLSESLKPKTWTAVEDAFLRGMEGFDHNVATGAADMGDLQNGKGDFFNDLLALILENCAQVQLYSRGGVPGRIFPKHQLDIAYPGTGRIEFILEAKAVGTPRHSGIPRERPIGRPAAAELDKRVKEIALKTIDIKAEYERILAMKGESPNTTASELSPWLRSVKPRSYVFFAARVISDSDRDRVVHFASIASRVCDGVGVFCFRPVSDDRPTTYRADTVPSHVALDRVLLRACEDLTSIKRQGSNDLAVARV